MSLGGVWLEPEGGGRRRSRDRSSLQHAKQSLASDPRNVCSGRFPPLQKTNHIRLFTYMLHTLDNGGQ